MKYILFTDRLRETLLVNPGLDFTSMFNNNCVVLKSEERQIVQAKCVCMCVRAVVQ